MRLRFASLALVLASFTACAHAPTAAPEAAAAAPAAEVPSTPAGGRLAWFLSLMNERHGALDVAEVEAAFAPSFLAQVPPSQVVGITKQIGRQVGTLALQSVQERSPEALVAIVGAGDAKLQVTVAVEPQEPHRFVGLLVGPARPERARPASWEAVDAELTALAPKANLLAARIEGDRCEPVREHARDAALGVGSTFKLYVLLAAADAAAAGKLDWKSALTVRDGWKSLPSGVMQNEPDGTAIPAEQVARQMISISDNTATDLLLRTVGRDAVEAAMARSGHAAPQANRPFFTTRELFQLKLGEEAGRSAYLAADETGKRAILAKLEGAALPDPASAAPWKTPRDIDTLEWFASPDDLCRAMAALKGAGEAEGSPVLDILSTNPGVRVDKERWSYVGFKGGSEPGVMNLTFLLRRKADGAWYFFSVGANDTEKEIDGGAMVAIAEGAIALLAE